MIFSFTSHDLLSSLCKGLYIVSLISLFPSVSAAKDDPPIEEISVFLNVPGLGGREVEAIIKGNEVYLSVTDVFDFLKIKNTISSNLDSVSGFFLDQKNRYLIDLNQNLIFLGNKTITLGKDEIIGTSTTLYLKLRNYGSIFGLDCAFNFRSLSVQLTTKLDLPVIREQRQELMRTNVSKLKKEIIADTILKRTYSAFNAGAFDWSVISTQQNQGLNNTRLNMRIGTIVAGGETNIVLNYDSQRKANLREQSYQWRYVNNDQKALRQAVAGKIAVQSTSSLFAPVVGLKLTNTATTYRRSFDSYTLSDFTEPDWLVELYVNNSLVDYVKADASGFFTFRVPLVYGNSALKLRFFGPWGEERTKEQIFNVPYNFLPSNEIEYTLTAGMLEDGKHSRFSRADFKYGLSKSITIGTGAEYLSSIRLNQVMPFVNASVRLASNLLFTADYTHNVRGTALLNYRLPSNLLIEINYIKYKKGQTAINGNFLEERKLFISKPLKLGSFYGFSRISLNQMVYPNSKQTTADFLFSAAARGMSASLTTTALSLTPDYLNIVSNLAMTFQLPYRFTFRPQIQYGYKFNTINEVRIELEKQVFKRGFLNLNYINNLNYNQENFGLSLRFDLSFARASFSARQTTDRLVLTQSLNGGASYSKRNSILDLNTSTNVGRGGLVVYPFLDLNLNNLRDKNEPKIPGLQLKVNGGRIEKNLSDTTIHIKDLEPYTDYLIELDPSSFDNIAWQLKNKTFKVTIEPNSQKLIEVPVKVSAEVTGMVYANSEVQTGQGRILVNFYRNGKLTSRTLSEGDGYYSYLGLSPGSYTAAVDSAQLARLKLRAFPPFINFTIDQDIDGDVVNDMDFKLGDLVLVNASPMNLRPARVQDVSNDPGRSGSGKLPGLKMPGNQDQKSELAASTPVYVNNFSIIASALGDRIKAAFIQKSLTTKYGHPVKVFFAGSNYYQLNIEGFETREDAEVLLSDLTRYGLKGLYITAVRRKIVPDAITSPKINPLIREDALYFALIVGEATDETTIKQEQERILKVLRYTSFPIRKEGVYRLMITGFSSRLTAELTYQKLINAGVKSGYIATYKKNFNQQSAK